MRRLLPICSLFVWGCVGAIAEPLPGGAGTGDPAATVDLPCTEGPLVVGLRQLTNREYSDTINDLFGIHLDLAASLPTDLTDDELVNAAGQSNVSPITVMRQLDLAQQVGTAVLGDATARARLVPCDASAGFEVCARGAVERLLLRGFNHPPEAGDVDRVLELIKTNGSATDLDAAMPVLISYVLLSPRFVYRVEAAAELLPSGTARALDSYEVAARLSYFLTGTLPDDALFALAQSDALQDPAVVSQQAQRLLQDPRAIDHLSKTFFDGWLAASDIYGASPDPATFPAFNDALRAAMYDEMQLTSAELVRSDLPMSALLNPGFTYVNAALATHYGISGVTATTPQRVALDASSVRNGLLTRGAFLTATSHPSSTSIVRRGKYVLERLLCAPPPPPPPDVLDAIMATQSMMAAPQESGRVLMEQHAASPSCAGCHSRMDPIGFGLENFDAVGQWRTTERVAATVTVWARVLAPSGSADSVFMAFDGQGFTPNDGFSPESQWAWVKLQAESSMLANGPHTLRLRNRENGVGLDKLIVTTDATFDPRVDDHTFASGAESFVFEAEAPSTLGAPFTVVTDAAASGGKYLEVVSAGNFRDVTVPVDGVNINVVEYPFTTHSGAEIPIDASTQLSTGESFSNAQQLEQLLNANADFSRCVTAKVLAFAVHTATAEHSQCSIRQMTQAAEAGGARFSTLVQQVVSSPLFTFRVQE